MLHQKLKIVNKRRISQSEIRNSAAAESEGGQKFLPPNPLPFCPPERSVWRAKRAISSVQKMFEQSCIIPQWCPRRESNPHGLLHTILSRARLPVPPPGHCVFIVFLKMPYQLQTLDISPIPLLSFELDILVRGSIAAARVILLAQ
jgi:hypothetical protein